MCLVFASTNASWPYASATMTSTCAAANPTPLKCSKWRPRPERRKARGSWRSKSQRPTLLEFTICSLCEKKKTVRRWSYFSNVYLCTIVLSGLCSKARKKSVKMPRRKQRRLLGRPWSWWRDWDRPRSRQRELKMVWQVSECTCTCIELSFPLLLFCIRTWK